MHYSRNELETIGEAALADFRRFLCRKTDKSKNKARRTGSYRSVRRFRALSALSYPAPPPHIFIQNDCGR